MANEVSGDALGELLGVEIPDNCEITIRKIDADQLTDEALESVAGGATRRRGDVVQTFKNRASIRLRRFGHQDRSRAISQTCVCFSD